MNVRMCNGTECAHLVRVHVYESKSIVYTRFNLAKFHLKYILLTVLLTSSRSYCGLRPTVGAMRYASYYVYLLPLVVSSWVLFSARLLQSPRCRSDVALVLACSVSGTLVLTCSLSISRCSNSIDSECCSPQIANAALHKTKSFAIKNTSEPSKQPFTTMSDYEEAVDITALLARACADSEDDDIMQLVDKAKRKLSTR